MNEKFFEIKKEKQDRIINGALKIFAMQGYRHASTDDIVKEAGISKGLLFHYFENKIGVYTFMYEYCIRYLCLEIRTDVELSSPDWFELQLQLAKARAKLGMQYPYMQLFLLRVKEELSKEAREAVKEKDALLLEQYHILETQVRIPGEPDEKKESLLRKMQEYITDGILRESMVNGRMDSQEVYEKTEQYLQLMKKLYE